MTPTSPSTSSLSSHTGSLEQQNLSEVDLQQILEMFETHRTNFNMFQSRYPTLHGSPEWNRIAAIKHLAEELTRMSTLVFENMAIQASMPMSKSSGWSASSPAVASLLSSFWLAEEECNSNQELCCDIPGLKVWKKDFGNNRIIVRGEFCVPVTAKQYSDYASNITYRTEWDPNVAEARIVEKLDTYVDICYVSFKRIATIYPRDYINIRVIRPLECFGKKKKRRCQSSGSCPISSAEQNEALDEVPGELPWCRVYMFSEVDPRGWMPSSMSKHLAARVLPVTVERIVDCVLKRYGINWEAEEVFDFEANTWKIASGALEYCGRKYQALMQPTF